ncbi:MAG: hypothetical protein K9K63_07130 [Desulfotignum sp.]|nr:hypothetical protein [Desulfotignum sp.]MCF8088418.1 hypothetical protein [Desulfotignum sp.]MCF8137066.1 hypothetical protein [Desulfotignum sp.]
MLAHHFSDEPLAESHGAPLRGLIPDPGNATMTGCGKRVQRVNSI